MNRVGDYLGFVVRFLGVGYIVLWPLAGPGPLAASGLCGGTRRLPYLCDLPHVFGLPPGLHIAGMICAAYVGIGLIVRPLARWHRERANRANILAARMPAAALRPPGQKPLYPHRTVKPRSHFGLRNVPR